MFAGLVASAQPEPPLFAEGDDLGGGCCEREATHLRAQQSFESVMVSAFKTGNAVKIASYFGSNVDLSILEKENLVSKSQGQQILKGFFDKHKPSGFTIKHKGKTGSSEYIIGELKADKVYRVTLNAKSSGSKKTITSLTIEEN
ncbi:DUF4783 domain-containing protein [bacterium AH-315-B15]|nr:DUF4783 domain-containing protein [bacterium AH-315-B15]